MTKFNPGVQYRRFVVMIGAALLLITVTVASIWAMNVRSGLPSTAGPVLRPAPAHDLPATTTQSSPSSGPHGPVQVVRFTLYDAGILPKQARARKGLVAVTLEDQTGSSAGLIVERQNNGRAPERAGQVRHYDQSRRGRAELKLEPGVYAVIDGENPEHRAELIIEQ